MNTFVAKVAPKKIVANLVLMAMLVTQSFSGFVNLIPVASATGTMSFTAPVISSHIRGNYDITFNRGGFTWDVYLRYANGPDCSAIGTWNDIQTLANPTSSYTWNTTVLPGATDYCLRISNAGGDTEDVRLWNFTIDNTAPTISAVSIPNTSMKVGDVVTTTITVGSDADTLTLGTGTIDGFPLSGLTKVSDTSYTGSFTVTEGGTDIASGATIPVNLTLTDSAGNTSTAFTTAISQGADSVDAHSPTISAVSIPNNSMKVGDVVTATITVGSDTDTLVLGTGTINGFPLSGLTKVSDTSYTGSFTVTESGADRSAGSDIPLNITLMDIAGNTSTAFTTVISQGSDSIDANTPAAPFITAISGDNFINNSETGAITVTGTGEANATIHITLSDSGNTNSVSTTVTANGAGAYTATLDGTTALPSALVDGPIHATVTATDAAGNTGSVAMLYVTQGIQDSVAPVISSVVLPTGTYKIGQTFTGTITADAPGYTTGSISINGKDVTSTFVDNGSGTYSFAYTVTENDTDVLSGVPSISVVLRDIVGNINVAYTTATGSSGDVIIDAHKPVISNVSIPDVSMKIGDVVTVTLTTTSDTDTYTLGTGTIDGFPLSGLTKVNSTTYTGSFTVTESGTDIASGSTIPVNLTLLDTAGNTSTGYTVAITQANDAIDANRPVMVSARTTSTGTIDVTFNEGMNMLTKNDFGVGINASGSGITSSSNTSGPTVTLHLSSLITTGQVPTIYYDSTFAGGITDTAGNMAITASIVPVDGIAPTATIASTESSNTVPTLAMSWNTITVVFTGSEALTGVTLVLSGSQTQNFAITGQWTDTLTGTLILDGTTWNNIEETADIKLNYTDSVGNVGNQVLGNFVLDTKSPTAVSITSHSSGSTVWGNITLTATGLDLGIANVEFFYSSNADGSTPTSLGLDTTLPYSTGAFDSSILGTGLKYFYPVATDNAGNTTTGAIIAMTIDNSKPTVSNLNFPSQVSSNTTIVWTANHSSLNITEAKYYIDSISSDHSGTLVVTLSGTTATFSGIVDVSGISNGVHIIYVHSKNSDWVWGNTYGTVTFEKVADGSTQYTKDEIATLFTTNLSNYYTSGAIDAMSGAIHDRISTLSGSVYSSGQVDTLLANMLADIQANYYTTGAVNALFTTNLSNYYSTGEINNILTNYYTNTQVYSTGEVNALISGLSSTYYSSGAIDTMFTNYYNSGSINTMFANMVAPTISYTSIANQFNVSSVPSSIDFTITDNNGVTSVTYVNGAQTGALSLSGGVYNLPLSSTVGLHVYRISAKDAQNNTTTETVTYNVVADSVTNVNIQGYTVSNLSATGVTISWETDATASDSKVDVYANGTSLLNQTASVSGTGNTITLTNLTANKTYTVKVKSKVTGQANYTELTFPIKTASSNTGLVVTNISRIPHGDVTVGGDYGSGYHFRFAATANSLTETGVSFKLADWSNGLSTLSASGYAQMAVSANGYDTYAAATGSLVNVTNSYSGTPINIASFDMDETLGGRQFMVDLFYKVPTGAAGAYSTSYGIKTE